jgi:tRNA A37 threonylcarbamoyladenosine dehydratase
LTDNEPTVTAGAGVAVDARFAAIERLYGIGSANVLGGLRVCVVGIGGVGSWAAEALARTGVGSITLIDHDDVDLGNVNRQLHALSATLGYPKVELMRERIAGINPRCVCTAVDDFLTTTTLDKYLLADYDYVIDAIDSIKFKAAMIARCKRTKIPIVTTGGAGGRTDPTAIEVADLSRTWNDALAAKVRSRLRAEYGFTKNPKRRFGVECVFSTQQPVYPKENGSVSYRKPGIHGVSLDCQFGYGSASFVTASFGFTAASRVVNRSLVRAGVEVVG